MADMPVGVYDDWLRLVITHEYAHILTMDTTRGYSSFMRRVFGRTLPGADWLSFTMFLATAPPNLFLPPWWLEGAATWAETEYSEGGRGGGAYFDMVYRMAVLESNLPSVDRINGEMPDMPGRELPYLYGYAMQRYLSGRYGKDAVSRLNIAHAGRPPYFISGAADNLFNKDYEELFVEMLADLKKSQNAKFAALRKMPFTKTEPLPIAGEKLGPPRYSPDGKYVAMVRRDPHSHGGIAIIDTTTMSERAFIRKLPSDGSISWSPDGTRIYFTQGELAGWNLYQDLYAADINSGHIERLTENMRVKDAELSRDGSTLVFVKVQAEAQSLMTMKAASFGADGFGAKELAAFSGSRVSNPRWSPDGRRIVFSLKTGAGNALKIFDISTGRAETLVDDGNENNHPAWSPDGAFVLFTSDKTGVFNLFAKSLVANLVNLASSASSASSANSIRQVTHLAGGAFHPAVSPDGKRILFSSYHSKSVRIEQMMFDPAAWLAGSSPSIKTNAAVSALPDTLKQEKAPASAPREYSSLESVMPRFWLPTAKLDHAGPVYGAFTAGQDPLGYHTYTLEAGRGLDSDTYYLADYVYDRYYPTVHISAFAQPVVYTDFDQKNRRSLYEKQTEFGATVTLPLAKLETSWAFILGWHFLHQERLAKMVDATVDVFEGNRGHVTAGILFDNTIKYPYSISSEEGRRSSLTLKHYAAALGSDVDSGELVASDEEHFRLIGHGVLYGRVKAATSWGDVIAQQAFRMGGDPALNIDFPLRGFPSGYRTGRHAGIVTAEVRYPLAWLFEGFGTKPFFLNNIHVVPFVDAGNVWNDGGVSTNNADLGVGVEMRLNAVIGYHLEITPAFGIARGVTKGGETQAYITIYTAL